jgi:iron(III) transport system ATP-binding protein
MIAGLETPDAGDILFDDVCVFSAERKINIPPEARGLGFVFQDFALWPHMSVFENVAFGIRAAKQTKNLKERVHNALASVRLDGFANRYPHQLSGGQQQRVAFARAIVIRPECILFDEPLSALDAVLREEMRVELKELVTGLGITAVFVTHDQSEAMSLSDEIIVLNCGQIEQRGTPEEIYSRPKTRFVARFVGRSNWIGENQMFRPEAFTINSDANAREYRVKVKSSQFVGSGYEMRFEYEDDIWYGTPRCLRVLTKARFLFM